MATVDPVDDALRRALSGDKTAILPQFDELGGYGGCSFTLLPDGRFRCSSCCDTDTYDRDVIVRLRDWLSSVLDGDS